MRETFLEREKQVGKRIGTIECVARSKEPSRGVEEDNSCDQSDRLVGIVSPLIKLSAISNISSPVASPNREGEEVEEEEEEGGGEEYQVDIGRWGTDGWKRRRRKKKKKEKGYEEHLSSQRNLVHREKRHVSRVRTSSLRGHRYDDVDPFFLFPLSLSLFPFILALL